MGHNEFIMYFCIHLFNAFINSEYFKDYYTTEISILSFGANRCPVGKKSWSFDLIYDSSGKTIICTKLEGFNIAYSREMVGKDSGTCRDS